MILASKGGVLMKKQDKNTGLLEIHGEATGDKIVTLEL